MVDKYIKVTLELIFITFYFILDIDNILCLFLGGSL